MIADEIKGLMWKVAKDERYKSIAGDFIMHMAIDSGDVLLVDQLIKNSGYLDIPNEDGYTPLHLAVFNGDIEMTRLLLLAGANPNMSCINTYETPLHFAAIHGDKQLMIILINAGADINIYNRKKNTSLAQLLISKHAPLFIDLFNEHEQIKSIVDNRTLLQCYDIAIKKEFLEVKSLIKRLLIVSPGQ